MARNVEKWEVGEMNELRKLDVPQLSKVGRVALKYYIRDMVALQVRW